MVVRDCMELARALGTAMMLTCLGLGPACGDDTMADTRGVDTTPPTSTSTNTGGSETTTATTTVDTSADSGTTSGSGPSTDTSGPPTTGDDTTGGGGALGDPVVYRTPDVADVCAPTPARACTLGDMTWVTAEYGSIVERADAAWVDTHGAVYRLVAFVERVGPSNIDVFVVDEAGAPIEGLPVAFYYDSLETLSRPDEWYPVKIEAVTDVTGRVGFALGGGAYLPACGAGGPHAIWVSEPGTMPDTTVATDLADRLGMLGGTEHRHLDLLFQRLAPGALPGDAWCPLGG